MDPELRTKDVISWELDQPTALQTAAPVTYAYLTTGISECPCKRPVKYRRMFRGDHVGRRVTTVYRHCFRA
jgi:hypothetical protein